jgi:NAD(P)-dependent dehydrogenase (short-subunit alcohol dehydrogenase family)
MPEYATYPSLRNKKVLVTGGAEGIGAAAILAFAAQGAQTIILDISEPSATALVEQIRGLGHPVPDFHQCDVTDLKQLKAIADEVLARYGAVDVLVNNAASAGGMARASTEQVTQEIWDFNIAVNLRHQFFLSQYLAPAMRKQKSGSIINMGSITWRIPAVGLPVYTTCKAAVTGLTRTHAKEFGVDDVRVNSIMPGSIATERQKKEVLTKEYEAETLAAQMIKRVLVPEEAARVILFLASDDASGVTGSSYVVDGGWVGDP